MLLKFGGKGGYLTKLLLQGLQAGHVAVVVDVAHRAVGIADVDVGDS